MLVVMQSGCQNCVWDIYRAELQRYTDYMKEYVSYAGWST
jgi:hypothetical protein